jgi:hypothetical protein
MGVQREPQGSEAVNELGPSLTDREVAVGVPGLARVHGLLAFRVPVRGVRARFLM